MAVPAATTISNPSTDYGPTTQLENRTDPGGTITTLQFDATVQNDQWKAYVGNITGALVLQNSQGYSIYEWYLDASSFTGSIFATRAASTPDWGSVNCSNRANITAEETALNIPSASSSTINKTFNFSLHQAMTDVGVNADTCNSTATWSNQSVQVVNDNSLFQEILLSDGSSGLIYATFIDQDSLGFDGNDTSPVTYDFQMIVPDTPGATTNNTYYFYADIA